MTAHEFMEKTLGVIYDHYAGILATVVFIWQLIQYRNDRIGRLKVTATIGTQLPIYGNGKTGDYQKTIFITVTNRGNDIRIINRCDLNLNIHSKNQVFTLIDFDKQNDLPKSLSRGDTYQKSYPYSVLDDVTEKKFEKVRFVVCDTLNKRYYSNFIRYIKTMND